MDPNAVVLEISSDEEVGWEGDDVRGISITDGGDDHNWIAELLDEVNRDDCGYYDGGDDSDEVVLVSEVLPSKKTRKKLTSKSSSLIDLDDDCVILDHDPDKPMGTLNDAPILGEDGDDSDDLLVVSEKGQVACRDYPHPRHLCIKFPFVSTPNQTHCHQCYCYVCDSLAPCIYWGNGSSVLHHCVATDKDDFWKLERQNSKKESKLIQPVLELADPSRLPHINLPLPLPLPPPTSDLFQTPSVAQNQVTRPNPIRVSPNPSNFGVPNVVNETRRPFSLSRNKYQPDLVSQQLIKTSFTSPRDRGQPNYNLAIPFHGPVFKRTGSAVVPPVANRYSYSSFRDSYRNSFPPGGRSRRQDFRLNEMAAGPNGSFSLPNIGSSTENSELLPEFPIHQPTSNTTQFEFSSRFQPEVNSDPYIENPVAFQPHLVTSQPQGQSGESFLPNYAIPYEGPVDRPSIPVSVYTQQGNEAQRPNIDPRFFQGISWPLSQSGGRSSVIEGTAATNESSVSGGLVDYEYDNWGYNCEAATMELPGALESAFIETGTENGRRDWC